MNRSKAWYKELRKPRFAPPAWVFAPVWTVLYIIIAVSFGAVAWVTYQGGVPVYVLVFFILNLVFNLLYSPIQFGLRNLLLATEDILLVLATLIAASIMIYPYAPWVAIVNIPYLLWVSFATVLQVKITLMNRNKWHT